MLQVSPGCLRHRRVGITTPAGRYETYSDQQRNVHSIRRVPFPFALIDQVAEIRGRARAARASSDDVYLRRAAPQIERIAGSAHELGPGRELIDPIRERVAMKRRRRSIYAQSAGPHHLQLEVQRLRPVPVDGEVLVGDRPGLVEPYAPERVERTLCPFFSRVEERTLIRERVLAFSCPFDLPAGPLEAHALLELVDLFEAHVAQNPVG